MNHEHGLQGLVVVAFESRRAAEMAELIRRQGGDAVVAPSMREVPLAEQTAAAELLRRLEAGTIDMVILLTGVGTRALAAAIETPRPRLAELLRAVALVARGPKPVAALRELGLAPDVVVPEPNTWRELLAAVAAHGPVLGRRIAIQEYGVENPDLVHGLTTGGAEVMRVPLYRWALPADTAPLRAAVARLAGGAADVALFTSATQVDHVMQIAAEAALHAALVDAAKRLVIASIGPVCSAALRGHGLPVDLEPAHPKMGHLVRAVAAQARELLHRKRNESRSEKH